MRKFIDQFSRFFVGALFIFSGLIKLNDPVGTQIKLEEYFEVFAQDFGSFFNVFIPWALEIGLILVVLEVVLGVAILLLYKMKTSTWVLLGLMVFFTFLTFYSAYFNKVTDCGCFGDAIKLTPWQSFEKDVVLMVFVLHLFWYRNRFVPALRTRPGHAVIILVTVLAFAAGIYAIRHLPFIDFRAYRVGNIIPDQMKAPEQPVIEYTFIKDGKETTSQKFLPAEEGFKYVSSRVLNEDKIRPKITDYSVTSSDGEDITQKTFQGPRLFIIITDVHHASVKNAAKLRALIAALDGKVECLILTSSLEDDIEDFRHENELAVPFAYVDNTVLKTIIRSNPGIALWKDGKVLGNWHYNDTPDFNHVMKLAGH